jgi:hypothetical protein
MKPENQKWSDKVNEYHSIEEFEKKNKEEWVDRIFYWKQSILNNDYNFWLKLSLNWELLKKNENAHYEIKFSKCLIKNWKIIKNKDNFLKLKIKSKKLKI